jgi:hypothetical protein
MKNRLLSNVFVLLTVAGWADPAMAQQEDPKHALDRGSELARQEKFDEAIAVWLAVLDRLEPEDRATAQRKLGLAFKRTERLPEAWYYLTVYVGSSKGKGDETAAGWLREVETALQKTHVKVSLSCEPAGATVHLPPSTPSGVQTSTPCPVVWWFTPGRHQVRAEAPGHQPRTVQIDIGGTGDTGVRQIHLAALVPPGEPGEVGPGPGLPGPAVTDTRTGPPVKLRDTERFNLALWLSEGVLALAGRVERTNVTLDLAFQWRPSRWFRWEVGNTGVALEAPYVWTLGTAALLDLFGFYLRAGPELLVGGGNTYWGIRSGLGYAAFVGRGWYLDLGANVRVIPGDVVAWPVDGQLGVRYGF